MAWAIFTPSSLGEFRPAHPEFNGEKGPYRSPHRLEHFHRKPGPVFQAASVGIRPVVKQGGQELVDQPAVAPVDHHHFKARPFGQARGVAVGRHNIIDQLLGQGPYGYPVSPYPVAGPPLVQIVLPVLVRHVGTGKLAGMGQFNGRDGTMPADGIGRTGGCRQGIQDAFIQMIGMGSIGGRMDHQLGNGDRSGPTPGSQFVKSRGFGADAPVVGNVRASHGCRKDPVPESGPANGDGTGQMGKFAQHSLPPWIVVPVFFLTTLS